MKSISTHSTCVRHIPQRTCLACQKVKTKLALIRLVRTPDGKIEIDTSGKKAGRGAYLCQAWQCWEAGLGGNRLEHALRSHLTTDSKEQIANYARDLIKGAN